MRLRRGGAVRWASIGAAVCAVLVTVAVVAGLQDEPDASSRDGRQTPATTAAPHDVTFVGDSWTAAAGSESGRGYAVPAAEQLGWEHHVLGVGGTGYLQGAPHRNFAQRTGPAAGTGADVVVVQGSLNDQRSDLQALGPTAYDTLAGLRAAVRPGTVIIVIGAPYTPATDRAAIDVINDAIGQAATSLGLRFVDPAAENWTDPADPAIWADDNHPNDAGYALIADEVVELLEQSVQD